MANVTLPYTLANDTNADGGQVQQNFDAIVTQVNGNIDTTNLADNSVTTAKIVDNAVTLAKLASTVPLFDDISFASLNSSWSFTANTESNVFSLSVNATVDEYLIVLLEWNVTTNNTADALLRSRIYVDSTKTYETVYNMNDFNASPMLFSIQSITAGSHTVEGRLYCSDSGIVSAIDTPYAFMMALTFNTRT